MINLFVTKYLINLSLVISTEGCIMDNNRFEETHNSNDNNSTQKQRYRLITGAFNDKVTADQIATEIKERYGLTVYVIPEQLKRSSSSL